MLASTLDDRSCIYRERQSKTYLKIAKLGELLPALVPIFAKPAQEGLDSLMHNHMLSNIASLGKTFVA